jgi:hypothetical protein
MWYPISIHYLTLSFTISSSSLPDNFLNSSIVRMVYSSFRTGLAGE